MADPLTLALVQLTVGIGLSLVASLLTPPVKQEGPRLDDLSPSGTNPGQPIPKVFGCSTVPGQVIAQTALIERKNEEESGGKGGPSVSSTTYTYSVHCAVAFSSIPVGSIETIRANTKPIYGDTDLLTDADIDDLVQARYDEVYADWLAYLSSEDPSNPADNWTTAKKEKKAAKKANKEAKKYRKELEAEQADQVPYFDEIEIFYGSETQAPSGILESVVGAGKVPAYRGLCYFVLKNFQLAAFGNRMPVFEVETTRAPDLLGSVVETDGADTSPYEGYQRTGIVDWDRRIMYLRDADYQWTTLPNAPDFLLEYSLDTLAVVDSHDTRTISGHPLGMSFEAVDDRTGYLLGGHYDDDFLPDNQFSYVYDPATKTMVTNRQEAAADNPYNLWLAPSVIVWDATYEAAVAFTSDEGDSPAAHSFPALDFIAEFANPEPGVNAADGFPKWAAQYFGKGDPGEAWGFWMSPDDCRVMRYDVDSGGGVTETLVGTIGKAEISSGDFLRRNARHVPYHDPADNSLVFTLRMSDGYFVAKWSEAAGLHWVTEISAPEEDLGTTRLNHRLDGGFLVLENLTDYVIIVDLRTGEVSERTFYNTFLANNNFWDDRSGCQYIIDDSDAGGSPYTNPILRARCFSPTSECGTSVGDVIRDAMTNWTPDVSPFTEGDHFEISAELDTTEITGLTWTRLISAADVLDTLQKWLPIQYFESGERIKFRIKDSTVVATIDGAHMRHGAIGEDLPANVVTTRNDDVALPRELRVKFIDQARGYSVNTAYARLVNSQSSLVTTYDLPIVGIPSEGKRAAYRGMSDVFAARQRYDVALPLQYFILENGDSVEFPANDGNTSRGTIDRIEFGTNLAFKVSMSDHIDSELDLTFAADDSSIDLPDLNRGLESLTYILDTARLTDDADLDNGYALYGAMGGYTDAWPGAVLFRDTASGGAVTAFGADMSDPDETNFEVIGSSSVGVNAGAVVLAPSGAASEFVVDNGPSLVVEFDTSSPVFDSLTDTQFQTTFRNVFAIGSNTEGWEIVQAQNAAQIGDTAWEFWTLRRGMRGTEWAIPLIAEDDTVIHISEPAMLRDYFTAEDIGQTIVYRGATNGTDVVAAPDVNVTVVGRQLILYAPDLGEVYRDGSGEITGTIEGRALQANASGQFPIATADLDFDIVIYDGDPAASPPSTELRTISLTDTDAFTYSAASQVTDFGAVQGSVNATIYQLDVDGARGYGRNVLI